MTVYIKVTHDEYEHIIAIADTIKELANETGTTENAIKSAMSHNRSGVHKWCAYRKVAILEND